jgi:hypothetical protein
MDTKAGNGMALMTAKLIDNIAAKLINLQTEAQKNNNNLWKHAYMCLYSALDGMYVCCMYVYMYVCVYRMRRFSSYAKDEYSAIFAPAFTTAIGPPTSLPAKLYVCMHVWL